MTSEIIRSAVKQLGKERVEEILLESMGGESSVLGNPRLAILFHSGLFHFDEQFGLLFQDISEEESGNVKVIESNSVISSLPLAVLDRLGFIWSNKVSTEEVAALGDFESTAVASQAITRFVEKREEQARRKISLADIEKYALTPSEFIQACKALRGRYGKIDRILRKELGAYHPWKNLFGIYGDDLPNNAFGFECYLRTERYPLHITGDFFLPKYKFDYKSSPNPSFAGSNVVSGVEKRGGWNIKAKPASVPTKKFRKLDKAKAKADYLKRVLLLPKTN